MRTRRGSGRAAETRFCLKQRLLSVRGLARKQGHVRAEPGARRGRVVHPRLARIPRQNHRHAGMHVPVPRRWRPLSAPHTGARRRIRRTGPQGRGRAPAAGGKGTWSSPRPIRKTRARNGAAPAQQALAEHALFGGRLGPRVDDEPARPRPREPPGPELRTGPALRRDENGRAAGGKHSPALTAPGLLCSISRIMPSSSGLSASLNSV